MIPTLASCTGRMTAGEHRLAERLAQKLADGHLVWCDVPVGPKQARPDFLVLHPGRGLLVLETKPWKRDMLQHATPQYWELLVDGRHKVMMNPAAQARHCALQAVQALEGDPQLVHAEGPHRGKLAFPWGAGVVFTEITRQQFEAAGLAQAIASHLVICKDEMQEDVDAAAFEHRLWNMLQPPAAACALSPVQLARLRWTLFPQVRLPQPGAGSDAPEATPPPQVRVLDLQQEQLARSVGEGHRVIHGVAGSGKTLVLVQRAVQLARQPSARPVLVLCYNEPLARQLSATFAAQGLGERVQVRGFLAWCAEQLSLHGLPVPSQGLELSDRVADHLLRAVERRQIAGGQYHAVLVDEAHDFQPAWLQLAAQMVAAPGHHLLVLYDSGQDLHGRGRSNRLALRRLGIEAADRTASLPVNWRNPAPVLQLARRVAGAFLQAQPAEGDGVPLLEPVGGRRAGEAPVVVRVANPWEEALQVADLLTVANGDGHAWGSMAILCRRHGVLHECARVLAARGIPHQVVERAGDFQPGADRVQVMTMHASRGLEFPVVALAGVGTMPEAGEDLEEEARLFYIAATRATRRLLVTVSGDGHFGRLLAPA